MGGHRDSTGRDDALDGLADGQASRDGLADSVGQDMTGARGDLDPWNDQEVADPRLSCFAESTDRIVIRDCDSRESRPPAQSDEFRGGDVGVRRIPAVIVEIEEHAAPTQGPSL